MCRSGALARTWIPYRANTERYERIRFPDMKRIAALDGLRGLAILAVMTQHSPALGTIFPGTRYGWVGVDLFFVLSGFLITEILLVAKNRQHYYRNFFARRILRIWPLYMAVLIAVVFAIPLVAKPNYWP